ncbi:MAG: HPt (histidine-containing phosphotransfer) domain-containing protein [Flavobacteriales bacterium]|jgi:HPt (histidine-containing phosphotransfer) domain-containing protein
MEHPSLNYIKALSGDDEVFQAKLIAVIKAELPDEISEYDENMRNFAFAKAAENVHKIKHKLCILSLEESYELAVEFEEQLKEGDIKHKEKFKSILQACTDFISNL